MSQDQIEALRQAVALTPDNHVLRQMLADALRRAGKPSDALIEYATLLGANALDKSLLISVGELAADQGDTNLASNCLDGALKAGVIEGIAALRAKIDQKMEEQGFVRVLTPPAGGDESSDASAGEVEQEALVTFADVGGLDEVKKVIHRMIILPYLRPEVYRKYGRKSGGGVLMYGPPGCGKTLLARATAGECQLPFINVRIEDILDPYIGVSERNLHRTFEQARALAPCVVFIDEIDALGFARRKRSSSHGRPLVDQLLQELDSIGSENDDLLILAATNAPWDVDDALLRPGRFDRRVFVPPPDLPARVEIVKHHLVDVPCDEIDHAKVAQNTSLFSGADLGAVVQSAVDKVIDEALESGTEPPLTNKHLTLALRDIKPTTVDWLSRAQNYVEFSNEDERYDDVKAYLNSREVRKRLK